MVAWANDDVFLQIWIGVDDKLPRRLRAIFRTDPLELRHEMELSNWQLDGPIAQDTFASQKAQAAKRIAFASPCRAAAGCQADGQGEAGQGGACRQSTEVAMTR